MNFGHLKIILLIIILTTGGSLSFQILNSAISSDTSSPQNILLDSDNDGWSDADELIAGTDPNKSDSDDDGILDPEDPNPLSPTTPAPTVPATTTPSPTTPAPTVPATTTPSPTTPAPTVPAQEETIEIYHFHGIHQCTSCVLVDEYTRFTLETYFSDELEDGNIVYHSYNYEDPDNLSVVRWLNVYGSSLYVVKRGQNDETEITNITYKMWGLTANEDNYVSYFRSYVEELL